MNAKEKLERLADKLLDTGKRNNLINFRDTKATTAEIVFPSASEVFDRCSLGRSFEFFNPTIADYEDDVEASLALSRLPEENESENSDGAESIRKDKLTKEEFVEKYSSRVKKTSQLLAYAQTPNPLEAVKNIGKKAAGILDETGINVVYLAFGFVRWNEKEESKYYCRAPLLLVHAAIKTGTIEEPVKLEITDDDVIVNPTFNFLMKGQRGFELPPLGEDDNLESYLQKVSSLVKYYGWTVSNECKLGVFSFLKINMYEDLKNNSVKILENGNVRILLGETIDPNEAGNDRREDEEFRGNPLTDLHTVVDADSSQLEAIEMAKSGKSFVLQGPPGTGKSQTITNIIAECLYDGKTVLFVSEKQAALNVVYDKLRQAGLADFCLELHSYKANKKAVIDELIRTLEAPKTHVSSNAANEIREKLNAQMQLDRYAEELHRSRDVIGKSLYQLYELHAARREFPDVHVTIERLSEKGGDYLAKVTDLLRQYADYIPQIGIDYRKHPWYGFNRTSISYDERNQLRNDLSLLSGEAKGMAQTTESIKRKYDTRPMGFLDTVKWQKFLEFASDSKTVVPAMLQKNAFEYALPHINAMARISGEILPCEKALQEVYDDSILEEVPGRKYYEEVTEKHKSVFSRMFGKEYKLLANELRHYSKNRKKVPYRTVVRTMKQLAEYQNGIQRYNEEEITVRGSIGKAYCGIHTDWSLVRKELEKLNSFYHDEKTVFGTLSEMTGDVFSNSQQGFREDADMLKRKIDTFADAKSRVAKYFFTATLDIDQMSYQSVIEKLDACLNSFDQLETWMRFWSLMEELNNAGASGYIGRAIDMALPASKIVGTYEKNYYEQWIRMIILSSPALSEFSRIKQDNAVDKFCLKDKTQFELNKAQIVAKLSMRRPNTELVVGGSALGIIAREGRKKRKQMPIRKLLTETASVIQAIKPCFLMSPLSVSTFLEADRLRFDTVIFDEASQIFPQDAVGAIYRGKQVIVAGDSKQMPPSNFFNASIDIDDDDEDYSDIVDFESILDICSAVFTYRQLAWHYRSHYEQLIAYSNHNFYGDRLITFPSCCEDHEGIGVDYCYAGGTFDRRSKTNLLEAQKVVDLVFQNIEKYPERSLGVVAFSAAQQNLIDRLLSKRREADHSKETFFAGDRKEPFFVKNLETVQGDERDTIIFSVAYARDAQGRFINNFGPLNRQGGERRLNVAVTRAKENIQLVASIHYHDIDLSNTSSVGARLLREYLDYAENGEIALERSISVASEDSFDSDFEMEVCEFLRSKGLSVDTQVGCSGYRIDMAVKRSRSSQYVLAIECDGATYHSSKNARDRDRLRQQVLERMGWRFYRIWSTDWFKNKENEKALLLEAVRAALRKKESGTSSKTETYAEDIKDKYVSEVQESNISFPEYQTVDAYDIMRSYRWSFQKGIKHILEVEAPLSEEFLLRRICGLWDRTKVTSVVKEFFDNEMMMCERNGIIRRNGFLYLKEMGSIKLRVPGVKREVKHIAIEELADGLLTLIRENGNVQKEGLYRKMGDLLGCARTGDAMYYRFDEAMRYLEKTNRIVKEQ